jgi:hypothetical protein
MALRSFVVAAAMLVAGSAVLAKDNSVDKDSLRNPAAEWCCGESAAPASNENGLAPVDGYVSIDRLAWSDVKPGLDGANWNCKRPDGSRRCFSALPLSR